MWGGAEAGFDGPITVAVTNNAIIILESGAASAKHKVLKTPFWFHSELGVDKLCLHTIWPTEEMGYFAEKIVNDRH